jgi:hypothetical protein
MNATREVAPLGALRDRRYNLLSKPILHEYPMSNASIAKPNYGYYHQVLGEQMWSIACWTA